jgi:hypothetical protein
VSFFYPQLKAVKDVLNDQQLAIVQDVIFHHKLTCG